MSHPAAAESFFTSIFHFMEGEYTATRLQLWNLCIFEREARKERATFHVPYFASSLSLSSGWHSTPSVRELRRDALAALNRFQSRYPGYLTDATAAILAADPGVCGAVPPLYCSHTIGESGAMHRAYPGALFQAASQFNLLEFISPSVVPEDGITHYVYDKTQGPACALACMGGTAYRNYLLHPDFFPPPLSSSGDASAGAAGEDENEVAPPQLPPFSDVTGADTRGQQAEHQLNTLTDMMNYLLKGRATTSADSSSASLPPLPFDTFCTIKSGYFTPSPSLVLLQDRLCAIAAREKLSMSQVEDLLIQRLRIGLVENATVTSLLHTSPSPTSSSLTTAAPPLHEVWQTFNSALSLPPRDSCTTSMWQNMELLSRLILRGTYEATVLAGVQHTIQTLERLAEAAVPATSLRRTAIPPIFLTKVGGGVFQNDAAWIAPAIEAAVEQVSGLGVPLDIRLVHFCAVDPYYQNYLSHWNVE